MKKLSLPITLLFIFALFASPAISQDADADRIEKFVHQPEVEFDIYFLASDEFLGRDTGTQELKIASRYIATTFQTNGVQKPDGYDSYFQEVPFLRLPVPQSAEFRVDERTFTLGNDLLTLSPVRGEFSAEIIKLEYASEEEIAEQDVEGKFVVAEFGLPNVRSPQQAYGLSSEKRQWVQEAGGLGLIELYTSPQIPWPMITNFLGGERIEVDSNGEQREQIPHFWMNAVDGEKKDLISQQDGETAELSIEGDEPEEFNSRNVIGVVEGTDPDLKNEYILLSAHYDHIGLTDGAEPPFSGDEIHNGARDNAVGTSGIMFAARYFAENPPKRSVIFAGWTAEEQGLLGSAYFAENPMIPLEEIVYNLNIDGAGYNDTTKVTVIGLGRTEADDDLKAAASAFGLEAIGDPVPEQNLFDRSDNVNFARNGIPAPTYSLGITDFDDEINKYYHQPADEPDTINYSYITQYIRSYLFAAEAIANRDVAPFWIEGDVYEDAGKELYGRD